MQFGSGAGFLAICAVAVLIVLSQSQSGGDADNIEGIAEVNRLLAGLDQRGSLLGDPSAAARIVEYGDLQCPICKEYSTGVIEDLIAGPVSAGDARLQFRTWAVLGSQSVDAARAALAAGRQGRLWSFIELFYRNQGIEQTGYVTDEFLTAIARGAGVRDLARWNRERRSDRFDPELNSVASQATALGFTGTPSFAVLGTGGTAVPGTVPTLDSIESALREVGG